MSVESGRAAVWRCSHSPDPPAGLYSAGALYSLTTATALRGKNFRNEKCSHFIYVNQSIIIYMI